MIFHRQIFDFQLPPHPPHHTWRLRRSALQMWRVQIPAGEIFFYMCFLDSLGSLSFFEHADIYGDKT